MAPVETSEGSSARAKEERVLARAAANERRREKASGDKAAREQTKQEAREGTTRTEGRSSGRSFGCQVVVHLGVKL